MCLICTEFQKEKLTIEEAFSNLDEMSASLGDQHYEEVLTMLSDAMYELAEEETNDFSMHVNLMDNSEPTYDLSKHWDDVSDGWFSKYLNDYLFEVDDEESVELGNID